MKIQTSRGSGCPWHLSQKPPGTPSLQDTFQPSTEVSQPPLQLSPEQLARIATQKATCPFIGSALQSGALQARHQVEKPLASIEEVRRLGNSGGGDLGELLAFFASGNHSRMPGDQLVPQGLFSLDFPGSQGSHPGHSGILQGDPSKPDTGRFSEADFQRLAAHAQEGLIKRSKVGQFIAENLKRDDQSKVGGWHVAGLLAGDVLEFVKSTGPALLAQLSGTPQEAAAAQRALEVKLTRLLGENNLVGSAGEFGLLFALLANKPGAPIQDGEPALALSDVQRMFQEHSLPEGWESWKKTRLSWVANTTGLLLSAAKAYWGGSD